MWSAQTYERVESAAKVIKSGPPKLIESTPWIPAGIFKLWPKRILDDFGHGPRGNQTTSIHFNPRSMHQCNFRTQIPKKQMTNATRGPWKGAWTEKLASSTPNHGMPPMGPGNQERSCATKFQPAWPARCFLLTFKSEMACVYSPITVAHVGTWKMACVLGHAWPYQNAILVPKAQLVSHAFHAFSVGLWHLDVTGRWTEFPRRLWSHVHEAIASHCKLKPSGRDSISNCPWGCWSSKAECLWLHHRVPTHVWAGDA